MSPTPTWLAACALLCAVLSSRCSATSPPAERADALLDDALLAGAVAADAAASSGTYAGAEYRLPVTVIPYEYEVTLTLDDPEVDNFRGKVVIKTVAARTSSFITLHVDQLTVSSIAVSNTAGGTVDMTKDVSIDKKLQTITIDLKKKGGATHTLVPGEKYEVTLEYTGKLRGDMYGFYKSTYKPSDSGTPVRIAATQFEPAYARSAFPCWDEPHYKATFKIDITHAKDLTVLSNMAVESSSGTTDGKWLTIFKQTPPMSSYLVAFVVSNFQPAPGKFPPAEAATTPSPTAASTPAPAKEVPYKVYVRPDSLAQAEYAAEVGPLSLRQLEIFTGVDFTVSTLEKLDLIAIPDFSAGAMENWGLVTFRETGIMFDESESTDAARESIALVIAHEQTHMWFGDLVSPEWWGYVWLNEGFARYLQYVSMDLVKPAWRLMDTFRVRTLQGALAFDALATSHPMSATVYTPDQIQAIFDRISYDKGGSVLHMTRSVLGDDNFKKALNIYLNKMKFYVAKPSDLFQAFDAVANAPVTPLSIPLPEGVSVAEVLSTWTQEPGYPVVNITTLADGKVVAKQARFLSSGSATAGSGTAWWVPLTLSTNGSTSSVASVWLKPSSDATELGIKPAEYAWILANLEQNGFYRVNYDEANWRRLSGHLLSQKSDQLQAGAAGVSVRSRAQLLDDAMSLARAGQLRYPVALDLARYLRTEVDPIPWTAVFGHLSYISRMLAGSDAQPKFKALQLELLDLVCQSVGFKETDKETNDRDTNHLRLTFRATLMGQACGLEHKDCVNTATEAFKAFKVSSTKVSPSVRSTVYCTGLRAGNADDWNFLWNRYTTATSPGERSLILGALGCTQDTAKLDEYLQSSLDDTKVRAQDASSVFSSVLAGGDNLDRALAFFKANFDKIRTSYGGWSAIQNVVEGLASRIVDEKKLQELETFLSSADLGVAAAAAARSLETARSNIRWRSQHLAEVKDWLEGRNSGGGGGDDSGAGAAVLSAPLLLATVMAVFVL